MDTINERFKILRKECDKTQAEWGKILGIQTSGISDIEKGRRNVTEQHLIMLSNWKERLINIEWLRTGKGEMFINLPDEDETAALVSELLEDDGRNAFYGLIKDVMKAYDKLSPNSKKVIEELCTTVYENKKRRGD